MPRNQFQRMIFALLTVVITVHAYVFYSLYVVNGETLIQINNASGVIDAINKQGGVYMFAHYVPIWFVILIEFIFAYTLEVIMGSPCSFKIASRVFDPRKNHPMIFESSIIASTVMIMCPAMSFFAAIFYYPYYSGFNVITFLANWVKLVCYNFPFAFFSQLFFIQPVVRRIFKLLFKKDIEKREQLAKETEAEGGKLKAVSEIDAIEDIYKRIDEIKAEIDKENKVEIK